MVSYLIICRSLTFAQRTAAALERGGVPSRITRAPKIVAGEGCAYAVRVSEGMLAQSLVLLNRADLSPKRVFLTQADGSLAEVAL